MVTILLKDGENEIYNEAGRQVHGSKAAGLTGLNPRELLEAAIGLCVSLTLAQLLERDGIPVEKEIGIEVQAAKAEGVTNRFTDFDVSIDFPQLDPAYKEKVMVMIERGCTIGNTLKAGANITLRDSNSK